MNKLLPLGIAALLLLTGCGGKLDTSDGAAPLPSAVTSSSVTAESTSAAASTPGSEPSPSEESQTSQAASPSSAETSSPAAPSASPSPSSAATPSQEAVPFNPAINMTSQDITMAVAGQDMKMTIHNPTLGGVDTAAHQKFSDYYASERNIKLNEIAEFFKRYLPQEREMFCEADASCLPLVSSDKAGSNVLGDYVSAYEHLRFGHPRGVNNTSVVAGVMNLRTGEPLTFSDVFPNGFSLDAVEPVAPFPAECFKSHDGDPALDHAAFIIAEDGVHIFWDQRALGMGACGAPEGLVPWGNMAVRPAGA